MTDFPTPPSRRIPADVRDRIREQVFAELAEAPRSRLPRARGPLSVAAGVAVLAAGAMIVAQSVGGGDSVTGIPFPTTSPTASTAVPPPETAAELERCYGAVRTAGKVDEFPDRRLWRPVLSQRYDLVTVTGLLADGTPIFCQTTPTSVTVSDPKAPISRVAGTDVGAVFTTDQGVVAGVVDPSRSELVLNLLRPNEIGMSWSVDKVSGGLFMTVIQLRPAPPTEITIGVDGRDPVSLPRPAPPAVAVTDRPANPAPDRTSQRGRWLAECLDKSMTAVVDPGWEPAAIVSAQGSRLVLMRSGTHVAFCTVENLTRTRYFFRVLHDEPVEVTRPRPHSVHYLNTGYHAVQVVVVGLVPSAATTVTVRFTDGTSVDADVYHSTFAAPSPSRQTSFPDHPDPVRVASIRVLDAAGAVLYDGPFS
jgi:hypothetical protein